MKNMWWIYALLSAFFAGITAILAKVGVKGVDPDLATAVRTAYILLITWGIVFVKSGTACVGSLSANNMLFLGLSGAATGLSWLFYFRALQAGPVSLVAPLDKTSVAIAVLLSVVLLKETLTLKMVTGIALIIAGTLVIIM